MSRRWRRAAPMQSAMLEAATTVQRRGVGDRAVNGAVRRCRRESRWPRQAAGRSSASAGTRRDAQRLLGDRLLAAAPADGGRRLGHVRVHRARLRHLVERLGPRADARPARRLAAQGDAQRQGADGPAVPAALPARRRPAELKVVVNNAGGAAALGHARASTSSTPTRTRSLLHEFGLASDASRPFTVKPGGSADLVFPIVAPARVGQVAFKVTARAGDLSDGELRPLPVLPGRMHLVAVALRDAADPGSRRDDELPRPRARRRPDAHQRADGRDASTPSSSTGVLQALPYLVDYPYECTEQTLNRFLSTGILSGCSRQYPAVAKMAGEMAKRETRLETWDETDPNRKMALEETPWLQEARGGADPDLPLLNVLDPRIASAQREASLAKLAQDADLARRLPVVAGRAALALHDALHPVRLRQGARVRRRGAEGHGDAGPGPTCTGTTSTRSCATCARTTAAGSSSPSSTTCSRAIPTRPGREASSRTPSARRCSTSRSGTGRSTRPISRASSRSRSAAVPAARPTRARLRQRHGLGEDRRGPGHLLGARGPRLALVQRHHRDPRLRAARRSPSCDPRTRGATVSCSGCSSTRSSTTGSRPAPPPRSSTRWRTT